MAINPERQLRIRSRMAENYHLTEIGRKDMQHMFTDWLPRALFYDLTDDTVSVDVLVRKDLLVNRFVFVTTFLKDDGAAIKTVEYAEDRIRGKTCKQYDHKKSRYEGAKDGFDHRVVYYQPA